MVDKRLKGLSVLLTAMLVGVPVYSQTARYPDHSSSRQPVYGAPYQYPQQPQGYPNQQPYSQPYAGYQYAPYVDYSRQPTMNGRLYQSAEGFKSPNTYALAANQPPRPANSPYNAPGMDEPDLKYYMSLSYGVSTHDGKGITSNYYDYPVANVANSLGDAKITTIGFGAETRDGLRFEVGYTSLSGLGYPSKSTSTNQWCPADRDLDTGGFYYDCSKEMPIRGGGMQSNTLGLGVFYPISRLTGEIFEGLLKPYVGVGAGVSFNSIDDYTASDDVGYGEAPLDMSGNLYVNSSYSPGSYEMNGIINHFGASATSVAWNVELGLEMSLSKKARIDMYYRKNNYGKVASKGSVFTSYELVEILDPNFTTWPATGCDPTAMAAPYYFQYNAETGWCESYIGISDVIAEGASESGTIENTEMGVRLRMMF